MKKADLCAKIDQQIDEIYELREDNESLAEENEILREAIKEIEEDKKLLIVSDRLGGFVNVRNVMEQMEICRFVKWENEKLEEEIKKLKEENEKLTRKSGNPSQS